MGRKSAIRKRRRLFSFHPMSLFSDGQGGLVYSIQNPNTLYSDVDKTTLASVDGNVAVISDIINGNDATQGTGVSQWKLRQTASGIRYLEPDGSDDFFNFGPISSFSDSDFFFVFAINTGTTGYFAELRDETITLQRIFWLSSTGDIQHDDSTDSDNVNLSLSLNTDYIITVAQSGTTLIGRKNQVQQTTTIDNTVQALGRPHTIGCRTTNAGAETGFWDGRLYDMLAADYYDADAIVRAERYLSQQSKIPL